MFFCEFFETVKYTIFTEHLRVPSLYMEHICNIQKPNINLQPFKTLVYTRERENFLSFFSSDYVKVFNKY